MKKLFKVLGIAVLVVLALLVTLPLLVESRIDGIVRREAEKRLAARLDFERLDLSLLRHFPRASVDLKGLTLVGEGEFAGDTIVAARRISVVVNLGSLLGGEGLEVTKVVLTDPSVSARKLADGRVNWAVMKPSEEAGKPVGETEAVEEPSSFRLSVRDVRIDGARVSYRDDSSGMRLRTAPLRLRLRGDLSAAQADVRLRLDAADVTFAAGGAELLRGATVGAEIEAAADFAARRFELSRNRLRVNDVEVSLDGWVALSDEGVTMDLKAAAPKASFRDVLSLVPALYARDFRDLRATGELSLSAWARGTLAGERLPAFGVSLGVSDGTLRYASLPGVIERIDLKASLTNPGGPMDATELDVERFSLALGGNDLRASLHASRPVSDLRLRAELDGRIDLGALSEAYPLGEGTRLRGLITANVRGEGRMSDIRQKRYRQMQASGVFTIENLELSLPGVPEVHIDRASAGVSPDALTLGELTARIGRSDLAARGQLTDYLGYLLGEGDLAGKLYLRSELLDLNQLLPESSQPAAAAQEPDAAPAAEAKPLEVPRDMRLSLSVAFRKVLFRQMEIADLAGTLSMRGGVLSLDGLKMGLFGGRVNASGSYATADDPLHPSLSLDLSVQQASFARTFAELETVQRLVPLFEKTGGDYSLTLRMNARLQPSMQPDLGTLDARGEIRSEHIRLGNIAALDALARVLRDEGLRQIEARDVRIRFTVADGRIATQPFDIRMGKTSINLSGVTGLDETIDYTARVTLPVGSAGGVLSTFNVHIGGTFSSPEITLGLKEAARDAVRDVVEEQVQKLTGGKDVGEVLGEAFEQQAAKLRAEAARAGEKLVEAARGQRQQLIDKAKNPLAKAAAEKGGDALVREAEKQAANLAAQAEQQIETLRRKLMAEKGE